MIDTITGSGGQAAHFAGLVEHPDSLIEAVVERFGRLDAIIHNAGFVRDKTLRKMTDEQWQEVIDVHLSAAFKLTRAAWPHLKRLAEAESFLSRPHQGYTGISGSPTMLQPRWACMGSPDLSAWKVGDQTSRATVSRP